MIDQRPIECFKFTQEEYALYQSGVEIWRDAPDYGDYKISTHGRFMSFKHKKNGKIKRLNHTENGYLQVQLYSGDGKYITMKVHRIMGFAFLHNEDNLPEINHIDLVKKNNFLYNIEWILRIDNCRHARLNGHFTDYWKGKIGKECPFSKAVNQYDLDGNFIQSFDGIRDASRITRLNRNGIGRCTRNEINSAYGFIWKFSDN